MRIAAISDIHGNLPALEAVLEDITKRKVDSIICLGDLIGKGPSSREVIETCRRECDIVIKGNWDDSIYNAFINLTTKGAKEIHERSLWCINSAAPEQIEYLGSLPHSTELCLGGKLIRLFHAHPQNFNRYFPDSPLENRLELFNSYGSNTNVQADVAVYADIHGAYMQILQGKHLINVGSVGNPLDITQSSYVIFEGDNNDSATFAVQFVRVKYDIEKAVLLAKQSNVPDLDGYISELETARYFHRT